MLKPDGTYTPDPAAIFAGASSLYICGNELHNNDEDNNLSDEYSGMDEFMRQCMRVATEFEQWACCNVAFDETFEVWPYMLEESFGRAVFKQQGTLLKLDMVEDKDYPLIAEILKLPLQKP